MEGKTKATATSDAAEAGAGVGNRRTVSDAERDQTTTRLDQITDIGGDEAWQANLKRAYDEYQHESLTDVRKQRGYADVRENIMNQALQNAVETANMIAKQAVAHRDIAIDREWNVDEVSTLTAKSGAQADAMIAILAEAVARRLQDK